MVAVSVSIMAHPLRAAYVDELQVELGGVPVSWDSVPTMTEYDRDRVWQVCRGAWMAHDPQADWHVVVQDDAVLAPRFTEGMSAALEHVPLGVIVSAYLGTMRPNQQRVRQVIGDAERAGAAWVTMSQLYHGVAIAIPTDRILPMIEWADEQHGQADDRRISNYFNRQLGWGCWYTWPCLADHREGPSMVGHEASGRHAHRLADDATVPDWSALPAGESGGVRAFRNSQTGRIVVVRDDAKASQMARARRWDELDAATLPMAAHALR
jgi:hypothetical protein